MNKDDFNNLGMGISIVLASMYFVIPYDFFYSLSIRKKPAEVYAVNEMGMAIQRAESAESHAEEIKQDSNRAEQFIGYTSKMVKTTLTDKTHNGKSALDIMASGPIDSVSGFSDVLSGVPLGNSPNTEAKTILESTLKSIPETKSDDYDYGINTELGR